MKVSARAALAALILSAQASGSPRQEARAPEGFGATLTDAPAGLVLSSSAFVEPLTGEAEVPVGPGRTIRLAPGIRCTREGESCSLATHDGRNVEIEVGNEKIALLSPVTARLTDRGWEFGGGRPYVATTVTARRQPSGLVSELVLPDPKQDRKPRTRELKRKARVRWLYGDDPYPTAEVFNTEAIQQLVHLSPMGF